jgi:hypothetical protein
MNNIDFKQPYDRMEFLKFVERDFLPEDFRVEVENMDFSSTYTQQTTRLGTCESLGLEVIEITHSSTHDARVGLSKEAFRMLLNRSTHNRALILFVPQDTPSTYRFSLVTIDVTIDEHKVRRSYSNPRRYSFVLGSEAKVRTPQEYLIRKGRVKDLDDLQKRFSVEVLTKEFYAELSDWYSWAISLVKFPNAPADTIKEQQIEHNSKNVIRLLTRLLFVWFLKQKHLIPNELFDPKYLGDNILKNFDPLHEIGLFKDKGIESIYYKAILQNLFFATLNCPISSDNKMSRGFRTEGQHFDINSLMRYEKLFKNPQFFLELVNSKVPFLNGGLFDCLDDKQNKIYIDGFSDNLVKPNNLVVPDYLFFGEEKGKSIDLTWFYGGDKKKKNVNVRGLVDILNTYNFTIEENTPFDQEVSLDPELLGKVFENLLASYNPETKTTARKLTGSFYTPREIVQYMVDESLIAHLKRTVGEDLESEYRKLMQYTDEDLELTTSKKQEIIRSLNHCKIIDPACGSGAFPVGILQQMVHMLSQLDPGNVYWHQIVKESTLGEMSKALDIQDEEAREEAINDITRSFDKDVNRPDYARKLYLIENCIYGVDIQSIAVQISKLRFFISLVVEQVATQDANDNFGIRPLPNLEAKFVAANTLIGLGKKEATLFDNPEIAKKEEELKQAKHKIYGAKTSKTKQKYKDIVATLRVEIANKLAELGAIGNDAARQLAQWDMFDQNASSPFFDPEWMFGVSDGFDIVIANPPYVFTRDVEFAGDFKKYIEKEYFSKSKSEKKSKANQAGKINLFAVFVMKGIMLNSKKGVLSYILPNNILRTTTYDLVRRYILNNTSIDQIIDLGSGVFENVTASTVIIQLINNQDNHYITKAITNIENIEERKYDLENIPQSQFFKNTSYTFNIFGSDIINQLTNKINSCSIKLGEKCKYISPGIDGDKNRYIANNKANNEYKPIIFGKNISRYSIEFGNNYILYDRKLLNRAREEIIFISQKIVLQRISGGTHPITASLDMDAFYTFNSVNNIILKDAYKDYYKVCLCLLNSNVINWYYANNFSNNSNLTVNISKTYLEMLPFIDFENIDKKPIDDIVDKILDTKKSNPQADTTALESEIDRMVYELYGLTEEEIAIIENR